MLKKVKRYKNTQKGKEKGPFNVQKIVMRQDSRNIFFGIRERPWLKTYLIEEKAKKEADSPYFC